MKFPMTPNVRKHQKLDICQSTIRRAMGFSVGHKMVVGVAMIIDGVAKVVSGWGSTVAFGDMDMNCNGGTTGTERRGSWRAPVTSWMLDNENAMIKETINILKEAIRLWKIGLR